MKKILVLLIFPLMMTAQSIDHSKFDNLLNQYVSGVSVNYKGFQQNEAQLDAYLDDMSKIDVASYPVPERKAYWINLYNAATIKLILDHWPVKSIRDLHSGKPWDQKIVKTKLGLLTLNNVEHDILRKKHKDPRIHAVVNCASASCPPLRNEAYVAGQLDAQMDEATKDWVNRKTHNQIAPNQIMISSIFDWYAEDFGNIIDFLNKYSEVEINENAKISYLNYDWSLNN